MDMNMSLRLARVSASISNIKYGYEHDQQDQLNYVWY
jgi:hypothetical protein